MTGAEGQCCSTASRLCSTWVKMTEPVIYELTAFLNWLSFTICSPLWTNLKWQTASCINPKWAVSQYRTTATREPVFKGQVETVAIFFFKCQKKCVALHCCYLSQARSAHFWCAAFGLKPNHRIGVAHHCVLTPTLVSLGTWCLVVLASLPIAVWLAAKWNLLVSSHSFTMQVSCEAGPSVGTWILQGTSFVSSLMFKSQLCDLKVAFCSKSRFWFEDKSFRPSRTPKVLGGRFILGPPLWTGMKYFTNRWIGGVPQ